MVNKEGDLMDVKIRLMMLGKCQADLIEPLYTQYGIKANSSEISASLNPVRGFQPKPNNKVRPTYWGSAPSFVGLP